LKACYLLKANEFASHPGANLPVAPAFMIA
jgi:hypothetical protein